MRDPFVHSRPFPAGFDSDCGAGDAIEAGEGIVMVDGEAWHLRCVDHDDCPEGSTCEEE